MMTPEQESQVRLLADEFAHVTTHADAALAFAGAQYERLRIRFDLADEWPEALSEALQVVATDDASSDTDFLSIVLLPKRPPMVLFFSAEHEAEATYLVRRVTRALACAPEVWRIRPANRVAERVSGAR